MNTAHWIQHFEANTHRVVDLPSAPCSLPEHVRLPLAQSLAIFQLGETGGGTRLRAYARKVAPLESYRGYQRAIDLFIAEEQGHAALLARVLQHLGTQPLQKQWTNSVFRCTRSWINLEFTIQILLTAELIAEVYYGSLYLHVPDPVVRTMAHSVLRDEMKHLDFQADFLASRLRSLSPFRRRLWHWQFVAIHAVTATVVAWDHRVCLRALKIPLKTFRQRAAQARARFSRRLETRLFQPSDTYKIPRNFPKPHGVEKMHFHPQPHLHRIAP